MKMKYIVKMNGSYMKGFYSYTEASEFADWLMSRYHNDTVKVETVE